MILNFKLDSDKQIFYQLIPTAHVVIESFRPGIYHNGSHSGQMGKGEREGGPPLERKGRSVGWCSGDGVLCAVIMTPRHSAFPSTLVHTDN